MTLPVAWWKAFAKWIIEELRGRRVPRQPGIVTFKFTRTNGMTLTFAIVLPPTVPTDQVTGRTLTYTITPAGSTTPGPATSTAVVDAQQFTFNDGDTVAGFLVDTNVKGDSAPGPTTTTVMTEPAPTGPPTTPGAIAWNFVSVNP
jgi:hypothetical protein